MTPAMLLPIRPELRQEIAHELADARMPAPARPAPREGERGRDGTFQRNTDAAQ